MKEEKNKKKGIYSLIISHRKKKEEHINLLFWSPLDQEGESLPFQSNQA